MKRIIFGVLSLFFAFLFLFPSANKAHALFGCITWPPTVGMAAGCPCEFDFNCASSYCLKPIAVAGVCAPKAKPPDPDASGTITAVNLERVRFPVPQPPCASGAIDYNGKCTAVVTSLGTIEADPGKFISRLFSIMLAASGAIALLLIMRAGYSIMTARGNPEGIQKGREQIASAL